MYLIVSIPDPCCLSFLDIIQAFKIVYNVDDIDMNTFLPSRKIVSLKLVKPRATKSIKLHSYAMRRIPVWNSLPSEIVNSKTVVEFKTKLDKLWSDQRYN